MRDILFLFLNFIFDTHEDNKRIITEEFGTMTQPFSFLDYLLSKAFSSTSLLKVLNIFQSGL